MSILFAVIIFGLLIFIHEFGHFIIAKKNGVRVVEFSIGMGPTLFSFGKGETQYSLKLLPFGGACQMLNKEMIGEETISEYDSTRTFESKSVWSRMAIIFAGPLFNFILAFVLAIVVIGFIGYDPAVVTYVEDGSPAAEAGLKEGDIITKYEGMTVDIGRELYLEQYINGVPEDEISLEYKRDGKVYKATIKPEYIDQYLMGIQYNPNEAGRVIFTAVTAGYPCEQAGVKAGDKLVSINGVDIPDVAGFDAYLKEHPFGEDKLHIVLDRDGKKVEIDVTPMKSTALNVGFSYNAGGREKCNALDTIKYSFVEIKYQVVSVFKSLGMLFTGQLGVNDFTGPVGVTEVIDDVYQEAKDEGAGMVALNMANFGILLSANLGVMNLLPIPGLDGGRLVFLIIEAIRRKPVKHEEYINLAGMLLLMAFAMYILFKDIFSLF
ncbi:MAG: site-2 protease family protein [Lachnospiraceae bacterium]|nr:site-2 protease family protein [Lachnospiraceae bacterium]